MATNKTTRKTTLSAKQLHVIYAPAGRISWATNFYNKMHNMKLNRSDRKAAAARFKEQIASLNKTDRKRFFELQKTRKAA